mgnify:CR=1 FL=1
MSTFDKIDCAIASMVIPVPPAVMLTNYLLDDIPEGEFLQSCYELVIKTDYFDIYVENDQEKCSNADFAIETLYLYLKEVAGKDQLTGKQFRKKFSEIQAKLRKDMYADIHCNCVGKCALNYGNKIV